MVDNFDAEAGLPSLEEEVGEEGEEGNGGVNPSLDVNNRGRRSRKISMVERGRYAGGPSPFRNNFVDVRVFKHNVQITQDFHQVFIFYFVIHRVLLWLYV